MFQTSPNASRESVPVTASDVRWLPQGSVTVRDSSPVSVRGLVTPLIVISPSIVRSSPVPVIRVDLNVSVGYFSTPKKSSDLR